MQKARKDIDLGPKPGLRIRSGVIAPKQEKMPKRETEQHDDGNSDEEFPEDISLRNESRTEGGGDDKMIDLDDS